MISKMDDNNPSDHKKLLWCLVTWINNLVCKSDTKENTFHCFIYVFAYVFTYVLICHNIIIPSFIFALFPRLK